MYNEDNVKEIGRLIDESERIVITCHISPDGDAVGSSLGLCHVLRRMGKTANVVVPDQVPKSLMFLPGARGVLVYTRHYERCNAVIAGADLIFCLDFNDLKRLDNLSSAIGEAKCKKVLIDHHLYPSDFCDVTVSEPEASSTCELLFHVLEDAGLAGRMMGKASASCIYTGMMTDTGNFTYNSDDPSVYVVISKLLRKGIEKEKLYNAAMNTYSEDRLRLMSYAMLNNMKVWKKEHAALITLTKKELAQFNYKKGDTESLVNRPLAIPGVDWSVFLREDDNYIKVSMRSQGDFAVNTLCEQYFNGGGHKNASGGEFAGSMDEAVEVFMQIIDSLRTGNDNIN